MASGLSEIFGCEKSRTGRLGGDYGNPGKGEEVMNRCGNLLKFPEAFRNKPEL